MIPCLRTLTYVTNDEYRERTYSKKLGNYEQTRRRKNEDYQKAIEDLSKTTSNATNIDSLSEYIKNRLEVLQY